MFCKSCDPICEPKVTPVLYHFENLQKLKQKQFHNALTQLMALSMDQTRHQGTMNNFMFSAQFTNLTKRGNEQHCALEIFRKYGSVSHLFSCMY